MKREPETVPPKPWEQQPGETAKQFAAFCAYRDLPPHGRSVEAAARNNGRAYPTWAPVAARNRWVVRAALWDAEQDRAKRAAAIATVEEQAKKRVRGFDMAYDIGHTVLERHAKLIEEAPESTPYAPTVALDLMERGAKAGRLERGEPGDITHHNVTPNAPLPPSSVDYARLTPEELKALRALLAKATVVDGSAT